ncbi:transposase [Candidatus Uhrbacteria bacterium]|nr:transposase [Candidatus Uhrbacteria bacterium]
MRLFDFSVGEYYHVYNRGVDKRTIFHSQPDYQRFLDGMWIFNDTETRDELSFYLRKQHGWYGSPCAEVSAFSLMPNHFHLLIEETEKGGISNFMQRLGTGYTHYFNRKQERSGRLFESVFKAKHIDSEAYLEHITRYIHLNSLDLCGIDWKHGSLDPTKTREALRDYRWSSFPFYLAQKDTNFLNLKLLNGLFSSPEEHINYLLSYQPDNNLDDENA